MACRDVFVVHVLDPSLKPVRLVQRAKELMGQQWSAPRDAALSAMTFGGWMVDGGWPHDCWKEADAWVCLVR